MDLSVIELSAKHLFVWFEVLDFHEYQANTIVDFIRWFSET